MIVEKHFVILAFAHLFKLNCQRWSYEAETFLHEPSLRL